MDHYTHALASRNRAQLGGHSGVPPTDFNFDTAGKQAARSQTAAGQDFTGRMCSLCGFLHVGYDCRALK